MRTLEYHELITEIIVGKQEKKITDEFKQHILSNFDDHMDLTPYHLPIDLRIEGHFLTFETSYSFPIRTPYYGFPDSNW